MYRAATALTEVSALAEAKKWYEIAAERFTCREALVMLGQIAHDSDENRHTNELEKAERLLRSAISAESPMATYFLLEPPEYALDVARVALACVLQKRGTGTGERAALLRDVLSHEPVLAKRMLGADHPHWTASVLLAEEMIIADAGDWPAHRGRYEPQSDASAGLGVGECQPAPGCRGPGDRRGGRGGGRSYVEGPSSEQ